MEPAEGWSPGPPACCPAVSGGTKEVKEASDEQSLACFLKAPTRFLFFTGKGGVGKTSLACASAIALADRGKRVLLVSTDPASNLDEVLGQKLDGDAHGDSRRAASVALNIDPEAAARAYREKTRRAVSRQAAGSRRAEHGGTALRRLHDGDCRVR